MGNQGPLSSYSTEAWPSSAFSKNMPLQNEGRTQKIQLHN